MRKKIKSWIIKKENLIKNEKKKLNQTKNKNKNGKQKKLYGKNIKMYEWMQIGGRSEGQLNRSTIIYNDVNHPLNCLCYSSYKQ